MKKISILVVVAMAMISCGNTYKSQKIELANQNDSMNYALGLVNGAQLKQMQLSKDSSKAVINEFMQALDKGYAGEKEELSEAGVVGKNIGIAIKSSEKVGLADNPAWTLNEKIFFQGLINAIHNDTTMMSQDIARQFFQMEYQQSMGDSTKAEKAITSKCPKSAKTIALKSHNDSLNYAFGVLNGGEIKMYVLANDSNGEEEKELIKQINLSMKKNFHNAELANIGTQIGKSIKEQEAQGLIGEPSLSTDFEMIKQGFVNGLYGFDEMMSADEANMYIQNTMNQIKYGNTKEEGEKFLAENALKEGVIVTESGLQYEVIKMGKGKKPTAESTVKVHYHGTLINGSVFDSSVDRGEPIEFPLNGVIAGWTEGLQLMPIGSKFRFYIPQQLGYGANAAGSIPPYSTLIFDVELLDITK